MPVMLPKLRLSDEFTQERDWQTGRQGFTADLGREGPETVTNVTVDHYRAWPHLVMGG